MTAEHNNFNDLVDALSSELQLLQQLRDLNAEARHPLMTLDVPSVEAWVDRQQRLLASLSEASNVRADAQEACLPPSARGIAGSGGLATTVTLHALIGRAPEPVAAALRKLRDRLRQLRDEVAVLATRNEALIAQVLSFTDHMGRSLARSTEEEGYTAQGNRATKLNPGELFNSAV